MPAPTRGSLARIATPPNDRFAETAGRIVCSPAFWNLLSKRQVHRPYDPLFAVNRPHLVPCDRWTHVGIVSQAGYAIGYQLGLNVDLIDAGIKGHDTGHFPGGHNTETEIATMYGKPYTHENFGLVALEKIFDIPLPFEVAQCVALHSWSSGVMTRTDVTQECRVVAVADKLAYVAADALETRRLLRFCHHEHLDYGEKEREDLTAELDRLLARLWPAYRPFTYVSERWPGGFLSPSTARRWKQENRLAPGEEASVMFALLHHMEEAAITESLETGEVSFSRGDTAAAFNDLRKWLTRTIYKKADDKPREHAELKAALWLLEEEFPDFDPLLALYMCSDTIVHRAGALTGTSLAPPRYVDDTLTEWRVDVWEATLPASKAIRRGHGIDLFHVPDWILPPPDSQ